MHDGSTLATEVAILRAAGRHDAASADLVRTALHDAEPRLRVLALRVGGQRSLLTPADLSAALGDRDADVRREALTLLARRDDADDPVDEAVGLLGDTDALVAESAAFALGERPAPGAVPALARVARAHDDARCREAAVAALGSLGDPAGRDAVIAALDDRPSVRRRAVIALAAFEGPEVEAALSRAHQDRDWQVRAAAAELDDEPPAP